MHRFWDSIIEPVLEALQPQSIVEIDSKRILKGVGAVSWVYPLW